MYSYFDFGFITLPAYGCMIALGIVLANIAAMFVLHIESLELNDFILAEAYCLLGAFGGAKVLYLLVSVNDIDWTRITNAAYLNGILQSGFVFYGGLIGGLGLLLLCKKIHGIEIEIYARKFIFFIPFIHAFGRLGCFLAGCCYGRPYKGFGAVVFPEGSFAPAGVKLFPVQLLEAVCLLIISLTVLCLQLVWNYFYTIETYIILYAILRFALEYVRYDSARGKFLMFSTSQWISVGLVIVSIVMVYRYKGVRGNLKNDVDKKI